MSFGRALLLLFKQSQLKDLKAVKTQYLKIAVGTNFSEITHLLK